MKKRIVIVFSLLLFFCGLVVAMYPIVNGAVLDKAAVSAVESFKDTHAAVNPEPETDESIVERAYPELYEDMLGYNDRIYKENQSGLCDPWSYEQTSFELKDYGIDDGIIAVISIPKLELSMPVYLGASADNMAKGAVHLSETSLPIGGENTNCVIAGHRGWYGAQYFLHLDELSEGDMVELTNLWETLMYKVSEIRIIEPFAVEQIHIQPGRELLTLMTCHPPSTGGRFRYLVICERADIIEEENSGG